PDAEEIAQVKRVVEHFEATATVPEKAVFSQLVYLYQRKYMAMLNIPAQGASTLMGVQFAVKYVLQKRIREITKELSDTFPKLVENYHKYGYFWRLHEESLYKVDLMNQHELERLRGNIGSHLEAYIFGAPQEMHHTLLKSFIDVIDSKLFL